VLTTDPSSNNDQIYTLVPSGGDLYLVGNNSSISPYMGQWQIERRSAATGAPRTAFGTNGVVVSGWSPATAGPTTLRPTHPYAAASDGVHLYVGGAAHTMGSSGLTGYWRLEKRDAVTGAPRTGFGAGGAVDTLGYLGEIPRIRGLAIDATHCFTIGDEGGTAPRWRIEQRTR
jgi:hypothetical protein